MYAKFPFSTGNLVGRYLAGEVWRLWFAIAGVLLVLMLSTRFAAAINAAADGNLTPNVVLKIVGLGSLRYLSLLIPISLVLAVMLAFGRLYRDHEITALSACGFGQGALLRPLWRMGVLLTALTAWLSLIAGPWAARQGDLVAREAIASLRFSVFEPGRFRSFDDGKAVFYVDKLAGAHRDALQGIFIQLIDTEKDTRHYIRAARGEQFLADNGSRKLRLMDGEHWEGNLNRLDWQAVRFASLVLDLPTPPIAAMGDKRAFRQSWELWASQDLADQAEWHLRLAAPFAVFILLLMAVPLSYTAPRQGRYAKLFYGILFYFLYSNLLTLGASWIKKNKIPEVMGLWWVHLIFLGIAGYLYWRRGRV